MRFKVGYSKRPKGFFVMMYLDNDGWVQISGVIKDYIGAYTLLRQHEQI